MRAYPLYFDRPLVDRERRARRAAAAGIIALHVALLMWLLLAPQGRRVLDTAERLVVVQLGDAAARPAGKSRAPAQAGDRRDEHLPARAHVAAAPTAPQQSSLPVSAQPAQNSNQHIVSDSASDSMAGPPANGTSKGGTHSGAMRYHFRPPQTLHSWLPPYPEDAFRGNHQGAVDLLITIDADGKLLAARVDHSSGNASLDRAALESLDRYTFKAAERDGTPVRADAIVTVNWIITDAVIEHFGSPKIERIDPSNLLHQRQQNQYGSYLKALQRERDNDPAGR